MDSLQRVIEIITQYRKHGWSLSRVLLSKSLNDSHQASEAFNGAEVVSSDMDAAWFTRPSSAGRETWELRSLAEAPFALLEIIEKDAGTAERELILRATEERLRNSLGRVKVT